MIDVFFEKNKTLVFHINEMDSMKARTFLSSLDDIQELDFIESYKKFVKGKNPSLESSKWFDCPVHLKNLNSIDSFFGFSNFHPNLYSMYTHNIGHLMGLSKKTIQAYSTYMKLFFEFKKKKYKEVDRKDINDFLIHIISEKDPASSTIHLIISSLHFFFRDATGLYPNLKIERPKKERNLPEILNKDEVLKIIRATDNLKHRALLSLVYSSGLRVSEVVNLKIEDIDKERKIVKVASQDGKPNRTTILSRMGIDHVEEYLLHVGNPILLFPGQDSMRPISIRSAEKIFEAAKKKAGITKKVSIHSLRHAFATHLFESGTSIKYIQSLLGHKNLQTTQVYQLISEKRKENENSEKVVNFEKQDFNPKLFQNDVRLVKVG
ncbi:MAG: tyrosine-type recombinase/integrase [Leptospiraceae bacterium]|nr:tyrosine-type recombinase/integrase [Leptospiraceae bacterium]